MLAPYIMKTDQTKGGERVDKRDTARLIQWLTEHGHNTEEIVDCFNFMATGRKRDNDKAEDKDK